MPPRPRSRASKAFPKTLTGTLAAIALAVSTQPPRLPVPCQNHRLWPGRAILGRDEH